MEQLFERLALFRDQTYRNVVKVTEDFSDVTDNDLELEAIELVLGFVGRTKTIDPQKEFYYTTAIGYPFETDDYTVSRFSDGSFPVWYSSVESDTTVYETAYHMLVDENAVEHAEGDNIIYRDRLIYSVYCDAMLVDFVGKEKQYPDLTSNTYDFTQSVGQKIHEQELPGLITPSARCKGSNLNVFKKTVLSRPVPTWHLSYELNIKTNEVKIQFHSSKKRILIKF